MSINLYKIRKWYKMILGKSELHVEQDEGRCYSVDQISGYYNDLTDKILRFPSKNDVPMTYLDTGEHVYFPISIFQYGLAAYDLYLLGNDKTMLYKAINCANWAVENQEENGAWSTFKHKKPNTPYSGMAQGEAISLLLRVYNSISDDKYLEAVEKAKEFMLLPIECGGTTEYRGKDIFFYELQDDSLVLNGWIFSLWGIFDYCKYSNSEKEKNILHSTIESLEKFLHVFDNNYWSLYNDNGMICSPFYHKLHIAQLKTMYKITGKTVFLYYANKWERYQQSPINIARAYSKKVLQKIFEK